jgi:hypothetical protein
MRRSLTALLVAAGPLVYLARRRASGRERVRLFYDDGSMVALERGSRDARRLLALARDGL